MSKLVEIGAAIGAELAALALFIGFVVWIFWSSR